MNRILIMGPPGAGKGTQAVTIAAHYGIPAISTGEIFRGHVAEGTALGRTAQRYMLAGEYVPDDVTNEMVRERLSRPDCRGDCGSDSGADSGGGFLLDGYPRTLDQVATLDKILAETGAAIDAVVALSVRTEELVGRLLRRAAVEQRADDTEGVIRRRLQVYADETEPLLDEYAARGVLVSVDGTGTVPDVAGRVFRAIDARR